MVSIHLRFEASDISSLGRVYSLAILVTTSIDYAYKNNQVAIQIHLNQSTLFFTPRRLDNIIDLHLHLIKVAEVI